MADRISTDRPLTPLMLAALRKAASPEGLGSWDYASGVLGALKKAGLVAEAGWQERRYLATPDGRRRLAEMGG